ncbi:MAG: hypothetical protein M1822_007437 [Bathelium mastoideum]|nr:MAG: hypothetical protein M1822_007437 [Bathelium mastoideum]
MDLKKYSYLSEPKVDGGAKEIIPLPAFQDGADKAKNGVALYGIAKGFRKYHRSALTLLTEDVFKGGGVEVASPTYLGEASMNSWSETLLSEIGPIFVDALRKPTRCTMLARNAPSSPTDPSVPRSRLDHCVETHRDRCRAPEIDAVPGFQLFDCRTRRVIDAKIKDRYVALSYVWGFVDEQSVGQLALSHHLPQTVEDAIQVTLGLDMRFLWIDHYCIPAEDHTQISMMDAIYEGAELTIIAADGDDANSGLRGISISRDEQPSLKLGSWQLTSVMPDPSRAIGESRWRTWA